MSQNLKYILLIIGLLISFFVLTGGITSSGDEGDYPAAPIINSFTITPSAPSLYQSVEFKADVTASSYEIEYDDCDKENEYYYENADDLTASIKILKGEEVIIDDVFELSSQNTLNHSGIFTYNTSFSSIGDYTVIATFTSTEYGADSSSTITMNFTVTLGDGQPLMPGRYNLTRFYAKCNEVASAFEMTTGLEGNYFEIDSTYTATLNIDFSLDNEVIVNHPCLSNAQYNFEVSGKILIVEEGEHSYMKIEYNDDIYAIFDFEFNESIMQLGFVDEDNNEFKLTFQKE